MERFVEKRDQIGAKCITTRPFCLRWSVRLATQQSRIPGSAPAGTLHPTAPGVLDHLLPEVRLQILVDRCSRRD